MPNATILNLYLTKKCKLAPVGSLALVSGSRQLTYAQLNEQVSQLSATLCQQDGDSSLVGISTTRGLETIVGVLAILRAGKAYVPLDPAYPTGRLRQMVANAGLTYCVAPASQARLFEDLGLQLLVADPEHSPAKAMASEPAATAQSELGYVLYTSGSTGEPKGVCMGQAALVNLLRWQNAHSAAGPGTRTLQFAPLSFDVSFQEIFATLSTGGTLVLLDEEQRLDLGALLDFIEQEQINRIFLPFVALQHLAELAVSRQQFPQSLTEIMTAGEQLKITPQLAAFCAALPACTLHNQYGPTETHVVTQLTLTGDPHTWDRLPSIGRAIDNTTIHLLAPDGQAAVPGEVGELCVSGACLAEGYLNQPARTAEKFGDWTTPGGEVVRLYRTGDLARQLPDGNLEFLGRQDDQVKIRGHRVELGEVEAVLATLPGVGQVAVAAWQEAAGLKELVAYIIPSGTAPLAPAALRQEAAQLLPDYMLPAAFVLLTEFPKTSSGKINRQALPAPATQQRAALGMPYQAPRTAIERELAAVWAPLLRLDKVGATDNFFELGGTSLLAQKCVAQILAQFGHRLPVTKLYQYPTVAAAAAYLAQPAGAAPTPLLEVQALGSQPMEATGGDVAIIGMAGRFPGANTVEELWDVLREGRETTRFFSDDELDASIPAAVRHDPLYVRARGVIDHAQDFDPAFFGLNAKLAVAMDPQQRVFLEVAWETLEQAGHLPAHYTGRVGVFAGTGNNSYFIQNVLPNKAAVDQLGDFQVMTVNEKDYLALRVAYTLDLRGPTVSVYSACSTSLLAIAQAVQSLRAGQCEVALAGGASITAPMHSGYLYQEGAMLSPDGHCRPFDAQAQGTVFSDGAGAVLLKSLTAAQRDGDVIYGVIKGVGIANDGRDKGSFSAPSAKGQAAAIGQALADGRVAPATISYVEAHGTATPLGDPIELDGLRLAFGAAAGRGTCALGSIKSNLGHLTAAAGVAGLIKTVLAMQHRQLPASLHYTQPNPLLDLESSPFFVNTALRDWPVAGSARRRAGISSFGVGGTNVHVVVEEAPTPLENVQAGPALGRPMQLAAWSARTASSSAAYAQRLAGWLANTPAPALGDVAFTLHTTRAPLAERRFVVAASTPELRAALVPEGAALAAVAARTVTEVPATVAFLFPGQGAQYVGMGRELYEHELAFRAAVAECAELLGEWLDVDIRQLIYPDPTPEAAAQAAARLQNTRYAQPALFVTEYALARLWQSWGVQPTALCGHSIGELVAACLAGVFTLPDALRLVAERGRLVSELPAGQMLAVRASAAQVAALLPPTLDVAAVNGPKAVVVAGTAEDIAAFADLLGAQNIPCRVLATSHAFHSRQLEPAVAAFAQVVAQVPLAAPQVPIVSTMTGTWLTNAQATDPAYWAAQLRQPVQFAAALATLLAEPGALLLEVGPGATLTALARPTGGAAHSALASLPVADSGQTDYQAILTTLGQIWLRGIEPDWHAFYAGQSRQKLRLPSYCFDRQRCWLEPVPPAVNTTMTIASAALAPIEIIPTLPPPLLSSYPMRQSLLLQKILAIVTDAADVDVTADQAGQSFLELGLDSLLLTQLALTLKKAFNVPVTFRQLNETLATPAALAAYLDAQLPAEAAPQPAPAPSAAPAAISPFATALPPLEGPAADSALGLLAAQLQLLTRQVALLQGTSGGALTSAMLPPAAPALPPASAPKPTLTAAEAVEHAKPFGATARIERQVAAMLTPRQQEFLNQFTRRYTQKTAASKAYAQEHRPHMADPRVVSGFTPLLKELTYPLVVDRSAGSRLWDLDGNEYVDALNGFGSSMFGYQPEFIKTALHAQIERGYEVGPQHVLAGEVCRLICELTGHQRAALCNTGSEAVLGALRVARTVTGRSLVVAFTGSYHGINDEVIVRVTKQLQARPAAPGIMPEAVQNMLILDYGTDESLRIIAERAHELAAVLVEPVQSRRPDFQPAAFLRELRRVTAAAGTTLIFDEVITGFRLHQGGAQAVFGVHADLATYGKVIGGGLPIGAIAGSSAFMDALDGGFWQYGDRSVPEVGVTYFAGTFVRHPLALAAAKASLRHMQAEGPALQEHLNAQTARLAAELNSAARQRQVPLEVVYFGSLWKIKFTTELPYGTLLFTLMREKGVHIWDNFPCFLTEAHSAADVQLIVTAFTDSLAELAADFLPPTTPLKPTEQPATTLQTLNRPPAPGARLGRDAAGNPAWFMSDPVRPGRYVQLSQA
ncbi:amino acid adenylation domain-containing protein [Hymenobacter sp. UV11]|uniref:polyketide synthase n=1 Tax=Hymenobacter sp. UV11 TaxID=1849735 RepID=UPI00105EC98A|nr:polyketide synthase [Hymenobacter sp. UV11]TDN37317.1 type I polyketide synthase [Hymenobacter sp. UV11]TFZ68504.1 amino acid adenylation domain-containing protein [Hymenobacter sp. UV11]